ncbi:conserved protein of unknown function [Acidithiobacillus ferrivorans]|uniref:Uncharacterized protein n=1 Tax=Acidithiobacillus ferrivorans TaxID=160808 RepID=A0A060UKF1_9PROT|nr:hypothetical protein [Acidithiobacillus ferrivorans]CDQ09152.1 conserved hypothetical protein [Acidithiobacillus ferrivorans]SMH67444.1 conserved protein of unknown function [Acidithiobacillus ferrivorans]
MIQEQQEEESGLTPLRSDAVILEGKTKRGKPCRVIDNTVSIPREDLADLLNDLIEQEHFGPSGLSMAGSNTISIGAPQSAHVQLGENIYRMIVVAYEARLEEF